MNTRYTYSVTWSPDDREHVGLCAEFPSLCWLAATHDAALQGIQEAVGLVVADMQANGETIPALSKP
jgi:predicted RNase H-like HicB family nuclease